MPSAQLRFPPQPSSVAAARAMLRRTLAEWDLPDLEFAAAQGLSELATNAVIHARTEFTVALEWDGHVLRVCVSDASSKLPVQRGYGVDATTGRGLSLLSRLCRSWGVERTEAGKQVWFEIEDGDVNWEFPDAVDLDDLADFDDIGGEVPAGRAGSGSVAVSWSVAA